MANAGLVRKESKTVSSPKVPVRLATALAKKSPPATKVAVEKVAVEKK
jgi:hypothetical protein